MAYTDMSAAFIYKKPLFQSKLDQLAENDNFLNSNSIDAGTVIVFFNTSPPIGYTQVTSHNAKMLRIVSGAGGGSGGSADPAATITKQHTAHSISSFAHDHDGSNHSHFMGVSFDTFIDGTNDYLDDSNPIKARAGGAGSTLDVLISETEEVTNGVFSEDSHDHGGSTTGSALTDINFNYNDVILASKDASAFTFTDLSSEFDHNDSVDFDPFALLQENDNYLEEKLINAGAVCFFPMSSAPQGWTVASISNEGAILRVVSGVGGATSIGNSSFSSNFIMAHNHSISTQPAHSHTIQNHSHNMGTVEVMDAGGAGSDEFVPDGSGFLERYTTGGAGSGSTVRNFTDTDGGGGSLVLQGSHTHTVDSYGSNFFFQQQVALQCSKDSGPATFEDLTSELVNKRLASKQRLNQLGENDEHIEYHRFQTGAKMYFFQAAAPSGWTKDIDLNDYGITLTRIVPAGHTFGTHPLSTPIPLQHSHVIQTGGAHVHEIINHTHTLATFPSLSLSASTGEYAVIPGPVTGALRSNDLDGGGSGRNKAINTFTQVDPPNQNTNNISHDHGGSTGTLLSDVALAYVDVIKCTKD